MERGVTDHLAETILAYQREVKRLRAALERIDGINDNPAIYNPDIEAVLRAALDN